MNPKLTPINFKQWINENRHHLKPPVGNKLIWEDQEFMVMVVGGPNVRQDYHINQGEEFFYQVEGDITVKLRVAGKPTEIKIHEGEIFLLPAKVPHSPKRPANTVGLVLERKRLKGELDQFVWYCENCDQKLYEESLELTDIVKQLPPLFERFYNHPENSTCKKCGTKMIRPNRA